MKILALFLPLFGRVPLGFSVADVESIVVHVRGGSMSWRRDDVNGMQVVSITELVRE